MRVASRRPSRRSPISFITGAATKTAHNQTYRTMIIVVTDEVGDDEQFDSKMPLLRPRKPRCLFMCWARRRSSGGTKDTWIMSTPRPNTSFATYRCGKGLKAWRSNRSGCRSGMVVPSMRSSRLALGRFALSRLATATGGIYFITRFDTRRMGFDPARMREYRPDWVRREEYEKEVSHSALRQAVLTAAQITQQRLPGMPSLYFPAADGPEFKEAMTNNQAIAERTAYTVDEALGPINAVAKLRDREKSRRWQAHYDLIRGRLLAMKVRCYEYNWACARMKKDPPKFSNPKSNAWRLVPDEAIQYSKNAAAAGQEAQVAACTASSTSMRQLLGPCSHSVS